MSGFDMADARERARISLALEQDDRCEDHLPRSVGLRGGYQMKML